MRRPRFLVLLAAYNGSRWIAEQIKSILAQTGVEVDVLISDDGSSDATPELLRAIADGKPIALTSPEQPTGSAAQNFFFLIRTASADNYDFVALADQDDIWEEAKLARACSQLRDADAAAYSCAVRAFWDDGREAVLRQSAALTASDFLFEGAGQGCTFVLTSKFYSRLRALLLSNAALSRNLHFHDWTVYAVSRCWNLRWVFDQEPQVRYRQHAFNDTGARASLVGVARRLSLIRNGWYVRQLRAIAAICAAAAPTERPLETWRDLINSPPRLSRKVRLLQFCLNGGRRRRLDNIILVVAIIAGWI
jgi:rhamnosyltransferase